MRLDRDTWRVRLFLVVLTPLAAALSVAATGFTQPSIPDGAFVQDAGGAIWFVHEGRRVRVPIYPATEDELAGLPMDGRWLVPQDGTLVLGDRPAWLHAEREGELGAGGGIAGVDGLVVTALRTARGWLLSFGELRPKPGLEYLTIEVQVRNDGNQSKRYSA